VFIGGTFEFVRVISVHSLERVIVYGVVPETCPSVVKVKRNISNLTSSLCVGTIDIQMRQPI
jgi:hypothetical protein